MPGVMMAMKMDNRVPRNGFERYNRARQQKAALRRAELLRLVRSGHDLTIRGTQAQLARVLGVDRATICRDARVLGFPDTGSALAPVCNTL